MGSVSLRVQVVLFKTSPTTVRRLLDGLAAAARCARESAGTIEIALGDCSPEPCVDDPGPLLDTARAAGLTACTYEHFGENLGSAGGSNRLAAGADADLLLILNPDTYPAPTLLLELCEAMRDPTIGIAEGHQIPFEHPKEFDLDSGVTRWASGACMMVRRTAFEAVGGFDTEHFFLHCDDVDLSWRIRLAGYRVVHIPRAVIFHDKRVADSGPIIAPEVEEYHGALGRMMLLHRYSDDAMIGHFVRLYEASDSASVREALSAYRRRLTAGRVPEPVPGASDVAQFVNGEFARHRF